MQLDCLLTDCPKDGLYVDYRKCCKCKYFKGQEVIGTVECTHPKAINKKVREFSYILGLVSTIYPRN